MNRQNIQFFIALIMLTTLLAGSSVHACCIELSKDTLKNYMGPDRITFNAEEYWDGYHEFSFSTDQCYQLSIQNSGTIKWFFSSALEGKVPYLGEAIAITDNSITHIFAICGTTKYNNWFQVYFGINASKPKALNNTYATYEDKIIVTTYPIYEGTILYLFCKNGSGTEKKLQHYSFDAKCLDSTMINAEIRKYLSYEDDYDSDSPAFQEILKRLFLRENGSCYMYERLISSVCYLPQSKNLEVEITRSMDRDSRFYSKIQ